MEDPLERGIPHPRNVGNNELILTPSLIANNLTEAIAPLGSTFYGFIPQPLEYYDEERAIHQFSDRGCVWLESNLSSEELGGDA